MTVYRQVAQQLIQEDLTVTSKLHYALRFQIILCYVNINGESKLKLLTLSQPYWL